MCVHTNPHLCFRSVSRHHSDNWLNALFSPTIETNGQEKQYRALEMPKRHASNAVESESEFSASTPDDADSESLSPPRRRTSKKKRSADDGRARNKRRKQRRSAHLRESRREHQVVCSEGSGSEHGVYGRDSSDAVESIVPSSDGESCGDDREAIAALDDTVHVPALDLRGFQSWEELDAYLKVYSRRAFQVC
ncbi:hypothetical protein PI125_g18228 [Phytophthora idaei]|nr:hypothetical protein PI125_g18228 [Phytophthora idaei]